MLSWSGMTKNRSPSLGLPNGVHVSAPIRSSVKGDYPPRESVLNQTFGESPVSIRSSIAPSYVVPVPLEEKSGDSTSPNNISFSLGSRQSNTFGTPSKNSLLQSSNSNENAYYASKGSLTQSNNSNENGYYISKGSSLAQSNNSNENPYYNKRMGTTPTESQKIPHKI